MKINVLPFASRKPGYEAATIGAQWWQIALSRTRLAIGRLLNRVRLPGPIQPVSIQDEVSGQTLDVRVGPLFTCISVNGRDYYFTRLTGRWDGTGLGCS